MHCFAPISCSSSSCFFNYYSHLLGEEETNHCGCLVKACSSGAGTTSTAPTNFRNKSVGTSMLNNNAPALFLWRRCHVWLECGTQQLWRRPTMQPARKRRQTCLLMVCNVREREAARWCLNNAMLHGTGGAVYIHGRYHLHMVSQWKMRSSLKKDWISL